MFAILIESTIKLPILATVLKGILSSMDTLALLVSGTNISIQLKILAKPVELEKFTTEQPKNVNQYLQQQIPVIP